LHQERLTSHRTFQIKRNGETDSHKVLPTLWSAPLFLAVRPYISRDRLAGALLTFAQFVEIPDPVTMVRPLRVGFVQSRFGFVEPVESKVRVLKVGVSNDIVRVQAGLLRDAR
jgi:hypothetical protein